MCFKVPVFIALQAGWLGRPLVRSQKARSDQSWLIFSFEKYSWKVPVAIKSTTISLAIDTARK